MDDKENCLGGKGKCLNAYSECLQRVFLEKNRSEGPIEVGRIQNCDEGY